MMPGLMTTPKQKVAVTDKAGKISQTQKAKLWAFHEITDYLDLPFRNDLGGQNATEVAAAIKRRIEEKIAEPSEESIIFMDGVDVTLAGKSYHVKRLPAAKDREWRKQVGKFIQEIVEYLREANIDTEGDNADKVGKDMLRVAMPYIMGDGMDGLIGLFWAYAIDLDRKEIEKAGTIYSEELMDAALGVFEMMLPFFIGQFKRIAKIVKRTGVLQAL